MRKLILASAVFAVLALSQTGCFYVAHPARHEIVYDERCWVDGHWVYRVWTDGHWAYRRWHKNGWVEERREEEFFHKYKWEKHEHEDLDDGRRW